MSIDIWDNLNLGLNFDADEDGANLEISIDHDELKGDVNIEFKKLLQETLDETFDNAEDNGAMTEVVIPEFEGMKQYFEECIELINVKLQEANDFIIEEASN